MGLVAEEPADPAGQHLGGVVEVHLTVGGGREQRDAGVRDGVEPLGQGALPYHRHGEDTPGARADAFPVVGIDGVTEQHDGVGAHRVGASDEGAGVPGFPRFDGDREQPRLVGEDGLERHVEQWADREDPGRGRGLGELRRRSGGDHENRDARRLGGVGDLSVPQLVLIGDQHHLGAVDRESRGHRVGPLGEETPLLAPLGSAMELCIRHDPRGSLGQDLRHRIIPRATRGSCVVWRNQAAGALTSAGRALRATSTRPVKASGSVTAMSASTLRSTSTPAALRPWMKRL